MKNIKIINWKARDTEGKEVEENIISVLTALLNLNPALMPKGFKQAVMFNRIIKAFENKEELILDDEDYIFLKKLIEEETPAIWGSNKNIMNALNNFNS